MKNIDYLYIDFLSKFKTVLLFISKNFGNINILRKKNEGLIPARNLEIKDSTVKGYIFHGYGCDFRFKEQSLDVEFDNDNIGFTDWSFFCFAKKSYPILTEDEIKKFLKEKVDARELRFNGKIYEINEAR